MSVASFVASQRTDHGVPHAKCCRWLGVSESWFYKWHDRPPTPREARRAELDAAVRASFDDSGGTPGTYGSPRVWEDLVEAGWRVSKNTVHPWLAKASRGGPRGANDVRSLVPTRPPRRSRTWCAGSSAPRPSINGGVVT